MAGDSLRPRSLWAIFVTILGGFLGGCCLAGGLAVLWVSRSLTDIEGGMQHDPGGGGGISWLMVIWLMVIMYGVVLVPVTFVLGGLVGSILCALIRRHTGKIPVFSYLGFGLALVSAVWLYWGSPPK